MVWFFFFSWFVASALPAALTLWPSTTKLCPSDLIIWLHNSFSSAVVPALRRLTNYICLCICGGFSVVSANMAVSSCALDVCIIFKQRHLLFWFWFWFTVKTLCFFKEKYFYSHFTGHNILARSQWNFLIICSFIFQFQSNSVYLLNSLQSKTQSSLISKAYLFNEHNGLEFSPRMDE